MTVIESLQLRAIAGNVPSSRSRRSPESHKLMISTHSTAIALR
ncbi:hypothetical protein [Sivoneniella epilithica]